MRTQLFAYKKSKLLPISTNSKMEGGIHPNLILVFGHADLIDDVQLFETLEAQFPNANKAFSSTSGEIYQTKVEDKSIIVTAIEFEKTEVVAHVINIADFKFAREAGENLAKQFDLKNLSYLLLLSDGIKVNGSELIVGLNDVFKNKVIITGGMAGDAENFSNTKVGLNSIPKEGGIVAIGFYGDALKVGHGSLGGWDVFGPSKKITKSKGNILYEINHKNAYDLYVDYLGKYSEDLPGSAMLFPLALNVDNSDELLVRSILSVDKLNKTMTFAGDMPMDSDVRFMTANFDNLIEAAGGAAKNAVSMMELNPQFALLISCVGRKIVLKKRIEEEIEEVADALHKNTVLSGFYSYGELSPMAGTLECQLHNQTMTVTTFSELI